MAFPLASRNVDPGPNASTGAVLTTTRTVTAATGGTVNNSVALDQAHSLIVVINITGYSAGTLTVTIKGSSATGAQWTILASNALSANGVTVLRVSPNLAASANVTAQDIVPPNIVISAVAASSPVFTYSIDVETSY